MPRTVRTARVSAERDGVNSDDRDGVGWSYEVAGKSMVGRQPETPSHRSGKRGGASAGTSQRRRRVDDVLLLCCCCQLLRELQMKLGMTGIRGSGRHELGVREMVKILVDGQGQFVSAIEG